jgi:hypothetical protein
MQAQLTPTNSVHLFLAPIPRGADGAIPGTVEDILDALVVAPSARQMEARPAFHRIERESLLRFATTPETR